MRAVFPQASRGRRAKAWVFRATRGIMAAMPDTTDDTVEIVETTGGHTILVVDDMSDNIILISLSLQDMGYRVVTATNGADALNVAKLARPDLILMDIAMPQQDGLAATRRIREEAELQTVPVIALTAFDTDGFRQAAFDAGFDGYLTKPIDFDRLRSLMAKLLSNDKGNTTRL
jgi:two-component system cell cycle response regulator DivK